MSAKTRDTTQSGQSPIGECVFKQISPLVGVYKPNNIYKHMKKKEEKQIEEWTEKSRPTSVINTWFKVSKFLLSGGGIYVCVCINNY